MTKSDQPYKERFDILIDNKPFQINVKVYDIVTYLSDVGGKFLQKDII